MIRAVGRCLAAIALGALLGPASLVFFYSLQSRLDLGFDRDPPPLVSGLHPVERDQQSGRTFAWTSRDMTVRLPGLDRSLEWVLQVTVRGARPDGRNPELQISADGDPLRTVRTGASFEAVTVTIPARAEPRRGLVLTLASSDTFVPGPADPRRLGVMLDALSLTPVGVALPPQRALAGAALAPAALGGAVALLGVTAGSAIGAAVLFCVTTGALLARGFAPYSNLPLQAAAAAVWIGLGLSITAFAIERVRRQPLRNTARFVAACSAGTLFLKWLVVLHPGMPIGDAMVHAQRFQEMLAGKAAAIASASQVWYPPGFYIFAAPFAGLVERGGADLALLRTLVLAVDAVAGSLLYAAIVHVWRERTTGALAVALYQLVPIDFLIVSGGSLTHAFAQSLAVIVFVLVTEAWLTWETRWPVAVVTAALLAAFVSHPSTFAILFTTGALVVVGFRWRGSAADRSAAAVVLAAVCAAGLLSVAAYYGHLGDTGFAHIGQETTRATGADGPGMAARAAAVPAELHRYLGIPTLALALVGAWHLIRARASDRLTRTVTAWIATGVLFLTLGVLTSVDMRDSLAAIPAVAVAAAAGAAALWNAKGLPRAAGAALLVWCVWTGAATWWRTLG